MNLEEKFKCIKYINPQAHCVVWEGGVVKYDAAHIGVKPTVKECEAVLPIIQKQIRIKDEEKLYEAVIKIKEAEILRRQAIVELKAEKL